MKDSDLIFGLMASINKSEYSVSDLKWLTKPFNISESSLRTTLSRITSKGTVESHKKGRNAFYKFSSKGKRISSNVSFSFKEPDWNNWDRSWMGVLFSVPVIDNSLRYHIRKKLTVYRFAPLYPGVWIRPHNKNEELENNLKDIITNRHCITVRFQSLSDISRKEVIRLWKLNDVNKSLGLGLKILDDKNRNLVSLSPENAFVDQMLTGGKIVNLLFKDPLLPWEFLPENWNGKQLRDKFSKWIKAVADISKPYWGEIFE